MSNPALNLLLAVVWVLLQADFSLAGLLTGLAVGFFAVALARDGSYASSFASLLRLCAHFAWELLVANLTLARDILRRTPTFHPGLVRIDVDDLGESGSALLANLISLTPGTLTVDMGERGRPVYVHTLYASDPAEVRRQIRELAARIRAVSGGR
ncbi:MAG: Na+/H+ antiporter subunit E [Byssovorax sp.]